MSDKKKLFVVSDIHGHYTQLQRALDEAGFDENNEDHVFVSCGDLFDRGSENRKVYDFVAHLERKILIRGNHDERLAEIFDEGRINFCDVHNGTDVTLEEFFGVGSVGGCGELRIPKDDMMVSSLRRLVDEMLDYYETENYVFVHGWLPTVRGEKPWRLVENWRDADAGAWHSARFFEWQLLYGTNDMLKGKTVVCGHRPTRLAYAFDPSRSLGDSSIYYGDGMIAVDAGTISSGRVNVLVIEENIKEEFL